MSKEVNGVNSKDMLKKAAKEQRKIKLNDRVKLEIVKATKHYREGQIIEPHRVFAEQLINDKIAKEAK